MDAAVATKSPAKSVLIKMHSDEAGMGLKSFWQGSFHFLSQPDDCLEWLQEEKALAMESGCALFAALREEDIIYSQPMNQLTLNLSFELKP